MTKEMRGLVPKSDEHTDEGDSAQLLTLLADHTDLQSFLDQLAVVAATRLSTEHEVVCGITQKRAKRNRVVASSSPLAQQMDEIQAGFNEGPCLRSEETGELIQVTDVHSENRWPNYMAAVRDAGMRSILSVPLIVEEATRAAMNLYTAEPGGFNEAEIDQAQRYGNLVTDVLAIMLRGVTSSELANDRRAAMESRTPINVAAGVLMAQNRCSHDQALAILQQASSHRNIKLNVLAEQLVGAIGHTTPNTAFDP